ncbi:MAG TPA: hypothetical protein VFV64_04525, partial [Permianibacter sp.]|nr:hypothetical protein [Permianibacter sp.]
PAPVRERFANLRPFTSEPGMELQPAFSPDGRWLAYVRFPPGSVAGEIQLRAVDAEQQVVVATPTGTPETPVWSPDGQYLAYVVRRAGSCDVHLARLAADSKRVLEDRAVSRCYGTSLGVGSLQWSSDGESLLFRKTLDGATPLVQFRWREGREQALAGVYPYVFAVHPKRPQLAYADVDTMSTTLHVRDLQSGQQHALLTRAEIFFGLAWDPLHHGLLTTRSLVGGQLEYWHPDGRRELLLPSAETLIEPAFSPDGRQLAVVQARMTYDLWQVNLPYRVSNAGAESQRPGRPLIQSNRFDYAPRFSHSGQRLAFFSTRSGVPAVWLAEADGSGQRLLFDLTEPGGGVVMPTHLRWSPDDRYLLVGATDLASYLYDFVSGQLRRLHERDIATLNPTWSYDGNVIYVSRRDASQWTIWQLELATGQWRALAGVVGAMAEATADGGSLYVLRYGDAETAGLWRYELASGRQQRLLPQLERRNWQNFSVVDDGFYFLQEAQGQLTVHEWREGQGATALLPLMSAQEAGPLFVDFAVSPDRRTLVYTLLADFESDILLLH